MMVQIHASNGETKILSGIHAGMIVYDWNGKKVGRVNFVYLPSKAGGDALYTAAMQAADAVDHSHNETRLYLLQSGFIQVENGLFRPMCYITPRQIHEVVDDSVKLNVARTALIGS